MKQSRELEREIDVLRGRLDAMQRASDASRAELADKETHYSRVDIKIRELELQVMS